MQKIVVNLLKENSTFLNSSELRLKSFYFSIEIDSADAICASCFIKCLRIDL